MKRVFLAALLLILPPSLLLAQDKGYWVLEKQAYSYNSYYYTHNYIDGTDRHESSRRLVSGGTAYVGGDTKGLTDPEEIARINGGFTGNSMKVGETGKSTVSWTEPPQKVKAGEESKIKMDASLDVVGLTDGEHLEVNIGLKRRDSGDFYPAPDKREKHNDAYESVDLSPSKTSIKNYSIWPKSFPMKPPLNHAPFYQLQLSITYDSPHGSNMDKSVSYYYKYVPDLKEETTVAADTPGEEQEGGTIPWGWIGVGIGVVVGGGLLVKRKPKNNKQDKKQEKKQEKEEDTPRGSFRMIFFKEFGDTLVMGEAPRRVGARIEEITENGLKKDRPDLTALITIAEEEHCTVTNPRVEGRYKYADVQAYSADGKTVPEYAKMRFTLNAPGGMFINHLVFKVAEEATLVMDENLSFGAYRHEELVMAIGMNGYRGQKVLKMEVLPSPDAQKDFAFDMKQDSEIPGKFIVKVRETAEPEDPSKPDERAGDIDSYSCQVQIYLDGLQEPVRGSFDLYRLHPGLQMELYYLKAYLVDYFSAYNSEILATDPKAKKKYGESRVNMKLIVEDPETGEFKCVIPDKDPHFIFLDQQEGSMFFLDKEGKEVQNLCERMGFTYSFQGVNEDNSFWGLIYATKGCLLPPNRGKAKVLASVSWKGQAFLQEAVVTIISQPVVTIDDDREYAKWLDENQRKCERLIELRSKIAFDVRFQELMPFYYKVHAMVEGYDPRFGIYEPDYEKVMDIFKKYCSGQIGNYFVNDSVWKPSWTEADENFNAFMATIGMMEKSAPVIGMRIALGFLTVGASELVFTPMSAMVKMQDYVNKGGDSAFNGFVVASTDVIFWEGVFYVGGKLFKYAAGTQTGQKIGEKAKAGYQKLKDGYQKIKASFTKAKEIEKGAKNLTNAKPVNTASLGNRVKEAGQKTQQIKSTTRSRANDAIRKMRSEGDSVFTKTSHFAEESAKRARQDARKIVDEFEAVMNNPTASPEEMRRATLALQGNKNAQNILRNHPSDLLRANFNAQMKEMYKNVDPVAMRKMEEILGLPEGSVKPWNGASGNDAKDLLYGRKIGADRDVTFQIEGPDGKMIDLPEDVMEQAYSEAFNEVMYGYFPKDRQQCLKILKKYDQAVVNGKLGLESYGDDLARIIGKGRQAEKLVDPERVARTFEHKCKEFIEQGKAIKEQAEQLRQAGFIDEAMRIHGYGEALIEEGIRQNTKQFKRILDPRIQALATKGHGKDFSALYEKVHILESLGNPPPKDALPITLEEARLTLQTQYNCTIEDVVKECAELIPEINKYL